MDDDAIWAMEERFWTGSTDYYGSALDPECIMVFPEPVGIMSGPSIMQSLAQAPRWASVTMTERHVAHPSPGLLVVGYRARGSRHGKTSYEALCTSAYHSADNGWKLVLHQQTPII